MKQLILLLTIVFLSGNLSGTPQKADSLLFEGKKYRIMNTILSEYFEMYPEKLPEMKYHSSNLDRGYFAEFEIKENQLFIDEIMINHKLKYKSVLKNTFPKYKTEKLSWYSGLLCIQLENYSEYSDKSKPWTYLSYLIIEIDQGNLIKTRRIDYNELNVFAEKQYIEFKRTNQYKELLEKTKLENKSEYEPDSLIRWKILKYTKKIMIE